MSLRARVASVCVVLALLAATARGDDVDERAQDVIDALRGGDTPRAAELLSDAGLADALASRPGLVQVLCDRAYRADDALRAAPAAVRATVTTALSALARRAHDAAPADARASWALAEALVIGERLGPVQGADAWLRAADLLEGVHASTPAAGEPLGYAVTFLLEGAVIEKDARHALSKRAAALARDAARAHAKEAGLATTLSSAYLWAARALLGDDRKAAKAALQATFQHLEPFADAVLPRRDVAALWNDAVTLDAEAGFALRRRYLTVPGEALGGRLRLDLPVSPRWTLTSVPGADGGAGYVYVTQAAADGAVLRQLLFRSYTWGFSYAFTGPNEVKGDNVKNVARGLRDVSAERVFAPGSRSEEVRKARVGDDLVGQSFVVSGTTAGEDGVPLTLHGWCVRGGRQATLGVLVYVYAPDGGIDAETQAVLDSLREPED